MMTIVQPRKHARARGSTESRHKALQIEDGTKGSDMGKCRVVAKAILVKVLVKDVLDVKVKSVCDPHHTLSTPNDYAHK